MADKEKKIRENDGGDKERDTAKTAAGAGKSCGSAQTDGNGKKTCDAGENPTPEDSTGETSAHNAERGEPGAESAKTAGARKEKSESTGQNAEDTESTGQNAKFLLIFEEFPINLLTLFCVILSFIVQDLDASGQAPEKHKNLGGTTLESVCCQPSNGLKLSATASMSFVSPCQDNA